MEYKKIKVCQILTQNEGENMEDKKYVSFLNSDMCLGSIQAVQMQKKCYDEFLKITNSPEEAKEQTLIFMTAFWRAGNKKNERDEFPE